MIWFILLVALLIPLAAVILDSQLGRALAGLVERMGRVDGDGGQDLLSAERVAALEAEVERLSIALKRVEEQSDFLQHLLSERSGAERALGPGSGDE